MSAPEVVVLDYGSGNLRSAERALEATGARVELTTDPERALSAQGLVVPGVGAFAACMEGLRAVGGDRVVRERRERGRPTLGICVGAQILFAAGIEHGERTEGCAQWPGVVEQVRARRLPHMGWNTVRSAEGSRLFSGLAEERFYFVHSYGVHTVEELRAGGALVTTAEHEGDVFVAGIEQDALSATQFHPEKSGAAGAALLANWVSALD
ncbi:imidazole glycerol phosphate synthase subunit HisH [Auraticoccus monumenti]|uniref:Imidazole glycerol phosphate synthase subunit HisH n=1 Tax=Auraticoccus monumenti TaxID=675864 RepID=A0A1G7B6F3_9ACTN|nr:imidazole glycerol phosphate synthase subunit HisH [Auraticoccus monumenti]SDE22659.1 glutamine amidotransferase [Auraticoccus monumenti]